MEIDSLKMECVRTTANWTELQTQKSVMKSQIEEYEDKIKRLINELEITSKNHIGKVNELHEHYMGYKSESAELQARINLQKSEQDRAL